MEDNILPEDAALMAFLTPVLLINCSCFVEFFHFQVSICDVSRSRNVRGLSAPKAKQTQPDLANYLPLHLNALLC